MSEKLKPCPFCGSEARMQLGTLYVRGKKPRRPVLTVGCSDPECILYLRLGKQKAARLMFTAVGKDTLIRRWNRRRNNGISAVNNG